VFCVVGGAGDLRLGRLPAPIGAKADEIEVDVARHYPDLAFPYIRIDDEWIRYRSISGRRFIGCERGVRGTEAVEHAADAMAIYGTSFSRVVRIPGARDSRWGEQ
jgi:hypothetical protein